MSKMPFLAVLVTGVSISSMAFAQYYGTCENTYVASKYNQLTSTQHGGGNYTQQVSLGDAPESLHGYECGGYCLFQDGNTYYLSNFSDSNSSSAGTIEELTQVSDSNGRITAKVEGYTESSFLHNVKDYKTQVTLDMSKKTLTEGDTNVGDCKPANGSFREAVNAIYSNAQTIAFASSYSNGLTKDAHGNLGWLSDFKKENMSATFHQAWPVAQKGQETRDMYLKIEKPQAMDTAALQAAAQGKSDFSGLFKNQKEVSVLCLDGGNTDSQAGILSTATAASPRSARVLDDTLNSFAVNVTFAKADATTDDPDATVAAELTWNPGRPDSHTSKVLSYKSDGTNKTLSYNADHSANQAAIAYVDRATARQTFGIDSDLVLINGDVPEFCLVDGK